MRGIRKKHDAASRQKVAATGDQGGLMLKLMPRDTLRGKRDRALPAYETAGVFRRSDFVALQVSDLRRVSEGLRVIIRKSKTDQEGAGHVIAILHGSKLKPVRALLEWLEAAEISSGPVFRSINRSGQVSGCGLTAQTVALVVKHYADAAGLDPDEFTGHSLRAGFLTSAAEAGTDVLRMMEVSHHKRVETVQGYVPRANLFRGHAGAKFL